MKTIPLAQLRTAHGNVWHDALNMGRVVDGVAVEVPDHFPFDAVQTVPAALPAIQAAVGTLFSSRLADSTIQFTRLAICQTCDHNQAGNCSLCKTCGGRPVEAKVKRLDESCPMQKWPVV